MIDPDSALAIALRENEMLAAERDALVKVVEQQELFMEWIGSGVREGTWRVSMPIECAALMRNWRALRLEQMLERTGLTIAEETP